MATIVELDGVAPRFGRDAWLAPTAVLVGDVTLGDRATVWFGAVLRGDISRIEIGAETSIQDNVVVHCGRLPTIVGARVTVGHGALLEGCVIEDGALIGMGAIVLRGARVGAGAVVAAGAVVREGARVAAGILAAGVPASEKRALDGEARGYPQRAADEYQRLREQYVRASVVTGGDGSVAPPVRRAP